MAYVEVVVVVAVVNVAGVQDNDHVCAKIQRKRTRADCTKKGRQNESLKERMEQQKCAPAMASTVGKDDRWYCGERERERGNPPHRMHGHCK